jgi:hypothetical protein
VVDECAQRPRVADRIAVAVVIEVHIHIPVHCRSIAESAWPITIGPRPSRTRHTGCADPIRASAHKRTVPSRAVRRVNRRRSSRSRPRDGAPAASRFRGLDEQHPATVTELMPTPHDSLDPHLRRCEGALVTLLGDIGPWSERIYLAGGLAPRYLIRQLPEAVPAHVGTTDVDLVIGRQRATASAWSSPARGPSTASHHRP